MMEAPRCRPLAYCCPRQTRQVRRCPMRPVQVATAQVVAAVAAGRYVADFRGRGRPPRVRKAEAYSAHRRSAAEVAVGH